MPLVLAVQLPRNGRVEMNAVLGGSEHWNTDAAVAKYTKPPQLMGGERRALADLFGNDLGGRRVLDLGCGGGRTTFFLRDMGGEVVGLDISERLIDAARTRFPHIEFRVGDAADLQYPDESFDCVLFSFNGLDCLYPTTMRRTCIHEIWRVLRSGGTFIVSSHNLAATLFGWHSMMRPWKLALRARSILSGRVFKRECYITESRNHGLRLYYSWPARFRSDVEATGFELVAIYANDSALAGFQRVFRTTALTQMCDPWPYYSFRKR